MSDEVVTGAPAPASAKSRALGARLPSSASIVFGAVILMLVLGFLGRPSVYPDTAGYMDGGRNFWATIAAPVRPASPADPVSPALAEMRHASESAALSELAARKPWYGVFAWPVERVGTLWLLAAVQSGLAAWLIWLTWRISAPGSPDWTAYAVQGVTAAFSTLPIVAGFAMPDVFAALMIIAVTLMLVAGERLHRNERTGLAVLVCFSAMAHGGNGLVALAVIVPAAMMGFRTAGFRGALSAPICTLIGVLGLGFCANTLFDLDVNLVHHQAPGRPPFLAARLIADGPGRTYLREACTNAEPYLLCRHKAKPLNDSVAILWSRNKAEGVYAVSTPSERLVLLRQEGRFVIGTILRDPVGVATTAAANWVKQLGMVYTEAPLVDQRFYLGRPENYPAEQPRTEELYMPTWDAKFVRDSSLPGMIKRLGYCTAAEPACQPRLTIPNAAPWQIAEFLAACTALAIIALRTVREPQTDPLWLKALGLVTFAVVVNALVCGVISGPFPRYQSSVAWLAVMMAAVGASAVAKRGQVPAR